MQGWKVARPLSTWRYFFTIWKHRSDYQHWGNCCSWISPKSIKVLTATISPGSQHSFISDQIRAMGCKDQTYPSNHRLRHLAWSILTSVHCTCIYLDPTLPMLLLLCHGSYHSLSALLVSQFSQYFTPYIVHGTWQNVDYKGRCTSAHPSIQGLWKF